MTGENTQKTLLARGGERWAIASLLMVYIASVLLPTGGLDRLPVLCTMRRLTGLPCPGCGMTHAFVALGHGDLAEAVRFNVMALPLFGAGLVWLGLKAWEMLSQRPLSMPPRVATCLMWTYAVALGVFGAWRLISPQLRPY